MRWSMVRLVLFGLLVLLLGGCGTDSDKEENDGDSGDGPDVTIQPSGMTLTKGDDALGTGKDETLKVNARVADVDGRLLEDIPVRFRIEGDDTVRFTAAEGTETSGDRFLTNASGMASILVSTPANPVNRNFDIVAVVDETKSQPLSIPVQGTSIEVDSPSTANFNEKLEVTATLTDSQGEPLDGRTLSFSAPGSTFTPEETTTNDRGRAKSELTVQATDSEVIRVEGAGAQTSKNLAVTDQELEVVQPASERPELGLQSNRAVTVRLVRSGVPQGNVSVNFSTSRGTIERSAITNANGEATVTLSAGTSAGPAVVTAKTDQVETSKEFLFVAEDPGRIDLQGNPAVLAPEDQSTVRASVRTDENQPVKGARVFFTIVEDDTGSSLSSTSAVTDEFGVAEVAFEAGRATGGSEGVEIEAEIDGMPSVDPAKTTLTVGGEALFLTVGAGNSILQNDEDTQYRKPYTVLVTDSSGGPVEGAQITVDVIPYSYFKGAWYWSASNNSWVQDGDVDSDSCSFENEDRNRNGLLDPGEDTNGTGQLEPGNVASLAPQRVLTDQNGFAEFELRYPQSYGSWVGVDITARAEVAGTETASTLSTNLPVSADDTSDQQVPPPFVTSPFGAGADLCHEAP